MQVFLETERVRLRPFTRADLDNLYELDSDPEVMRFITGGIPTPRDVIRDRTLPRFLRPDARFAGYDFWAAIERSTGRFLGWFEFRPRQPDGTDEVELGYRLRRDAWGQGYATEVARALIDTGFRELGVRRVVASTAAENRASRRVMEKAGMTLVRAYRQVWPGLYQDEPQDDVEYALHRADWEQLHQPA